MENKHRPTSREPFGAATGTSIPEGIAKLDLLQRIFENSPVPIFVKDADGMYLYVNEAFVAIGDTPEERIVGKKDTDIYSDVTAEVFRAEDLAVMKGSEPSESTQHLQLRGQERVFRTVKFPVYDTSGAVQGICGIALDVTDTLLEQKTREDERVRAIAAKPFERLFSSLTPQEVRVTELLLLGFSDKQIAETLHLTEDTIRHHVSHVLKKLRKHSRTQAVIALMRNRRRA